MSRWGLLLRNLMFFWRTNLAVCLGVLAATAVIGGALIVGDSMRASLRAMTLRRLGPVAAAVSGPRFVQESLSDRLNARWKAGDAQTPPLETAPALSLVVGVDHREGDSTRRASQVQLFGVDERLWSWIAPDKTPAPQARAAVVNARVAEALQLKVGDPITAWVELPSAVPRDSLLGHRDSTAQEVSLTVAAIIPETTTAGRFALQPNQESPLNIYMNLKSLQEDLDLAEVRPSRRDPQGSPARINSLYIRPLTSDAKTPPIAVTPEVAARLSQQLKDVWQLADLQIRVVPDAEQRFVSVESGQMLLDPLLKKAAEDAAATNGRPTSPVFVYLANSLTNTRDAEAFSMYSTVAGLDLLRMPATFGRFEFVGRKPDQLGPRDVVVNEWLAKDLKLQVGDTLKMAYHLLGSHGELPEESVVFTVRGVVRMTGAAADRHLTPEVKGITDADSLSDWDQPFPMDLDRVTSRDESYWDEFRATPKLFLNLPEAQTLWPSRYGQLTSIRLAPKPGETFEALETSLPAQLLSHLDPVATGLGVQPVREQGLAAASGSTDFSGLFVGFSFFLILAAVILVGLLFRLGIEQRAGAMGLLAAVGWTPARARRLFLVEGTLLAVVGGLLGTAAAIGYARLMIYGLTRWWIGAVRTTELSLALTPTSLALGAAIAVVMALVAMLWALWGLRRIEIRDLLTGVSSVALTPQARQRRRRRSSLIAAITAGAALLILAGLLTRLIPQREAFGGLSWPIVSFFLMGVLLLVAAVQGWGAWLDRDQPLALAGRGLGGLARLSWRNAARERGRSVLTMGLIASATFVIVAVAAGQKDPTRDRPDKASGNGGFTLVGQSTTPLLYNLDTPEGRTNLGVAQNLTPEQAALFGGMRVSSFRVNPGEDASCLNLFQTQLPTVLGVPQSFIERGGFHFVGADSANPWTMLNEKLPDGAVPAIGDMNTLLYSLHKGPGETIPVRPGQTPAQGSEPRLQVAGMLDGSVFQGVLLVSEENFLKLFPERAGYEYFLIETPPESAEALTTLLETKLTPFGFDAESVGERIARFLAVQNTYLMTFQALGGLGLLLGTLGLATVMLRNVLERQSEISLLQAVGYTRTSIGWLVLIENFVLLLSGLLAGAAAAILSMLPHLLGTGAEFPWRSGGLLLAAVLGFGLLAAFFAVNRAVRTPILENLRGI